MHPATQVVKHHVRTVENTGVDMVVGSRIKMNPGMDLYTCEQCHLAICQMCLEGGRHSRHRRYIMADIVE